MIDTHPYLHLMATVGYHNYLLFGKLGIGRRTYIEQFIRYLEGYNSIWKEGDQLDFPEHDLVLFDARESADEFRNKISFLKEHRPFVLSHKYAIFENVDKYSKNEIDTLLLLFENPPKHARMLSTAVSIDSIPESFVSRCFPIFLKPLDEAVVIDVLNDNGWKDEVKTIKGGISWKFSSPGEVIIYNKYKVDEVSKSYVDGVGTEELTRNLWESLGKDIRYHREDLFDLVMAIVISKMYRYWLLNDDGRIDQIGSSLQSAFTNKFASFVNGVVNRDNFVFSTERFLYHFAMQRELLEKC